MQRSAGLVLLALVGEVALNNIEGLGHTFVAMCGNDRTRLHNEVQYYRTERVVRVPDRQRNVTFTGKRETIPFNLTVKDFLIDHDTAPSSCFSESHGSGESVIANFNFSEMAFSS